MKDIFDSDCLIAFALRTPVGFAGIGQVFSGWMLFSYYYDDYEGYANPCSKRQTGPGHHGDDEYEYEIHHFEKFHDESRSLLPKPSILRYIDSISHQQIRGKRTSLTLKTSLTFENTMRWMLRRITRSKWTKCLSWNRTYLRSFGGTRGTGSHRIFYFTFTILFCWIKFWDAAGQNFLVNYPVTYFVLYVSLLVLFKMGDL